MAYPGWKREACQGQLGLGNKVFASVQETMDVLGGASFLTEWGGVYFTPGIDSPDNSSAKEEALWVMDEADAQLQSWTHWDIDYFVSVGADSGGFLGCAANSSFIRPGRCIKDFIRPYAQAIAGILQSRCTLIATPMSSLSRSSRIGQLKLHLRFFFHQIDIRMATMSL